MVKKIKNFKNSKNSKINFFQLFLTFLGPANTHQYYQGIQDTQAGQFDQKWGNAARSIGYNSSFGKQPKFNAALGNGGKRRRNPPSNGLTYVPPNVEESRVTKGVRF